MQPSSEPPAVASGAYPEALEESVTAQQQHEEGSTNTLGEARPKRTGPAVGNSEAMQHHSTEPGMAADAVQQPGSSDEGASLAVRCPEDTSTHMAPVGAEGGNTYSEGPKDQEEEEEEEEPRLKYQRLGSSVTDILSQDAASCLSVSDKLLALGTHDGTVHILDYAGNEVKRFEVHKSRVNDISIDEAAEYIASCSDDGSAAVHGLYTEESTRFKYNRPVKTIALDPRYGQRKTREFVTGGLAGQLLLSSKGWLGSRDTVLHSGEGTVSTARWAGNLIAWANDKGVKVYDVSLHQVVGVIPRPNSCVSWEVSRCQIFWEGDQLLYIGWAESVQVARIRAPKQAGPAAADSKLVIEIVAALRLDDCLIAGIAPFGEDIALLTYVLGEDTSPRAAASSSNGHSSNARRPELKIVDWQNVEKAADALSINGYEHYQANDYALEACYLPSNSLHTGQAKVKQVTKDFTKWWQDGDEPQYYLVSPKDIVVGRPRDGDDRVSWLIEHARFEQVAQAYLEHLLKEGKFKEAANLCPQLLKKDATAWERWVYLFAQLRQLAVLAPKLPTADPQLRGSAYEMVLHAFLLSPGDHPRLLELLDSWPPHLYSLPALTQAVLQRIRSSGGDSEALLESAARLYQLQARYDLTLAILLRLKRERVFDFICSHHLMPLLKGQAILQLLDIDPTRAIRLLVDYHEEVPATTVAPAIEAAVHESTDMQEVWRKRLHTYLDWLFLKDSVAGAAFHGLQVGLYATYEPERLMGFLISSQSYGLEAAHELCKNRGLVREQVFVLGRMGNTREALHLIIQRLSDIPQAIDFVQMQQDDELWDLLISLALGDASLTGALLDHIGSYINPLRLVARIPEGMLIKGLRDRLVTIVADFRSQTSLRQCCSSLLQQDCVVLAQRLYREMRKALMPLKLYVKAGTQWQKQGESEAAMAVDLADLPGPCGSKQLHLLPTDAPQPAVWVGFATQSPEAGSELGRESGANTSRSRGRSRLQKRRSEPEPQLPSLMVAH